MGWGWDSVKGDLMRTKKEEGIEDIQKRRVNWREREEKRGEERRSWQQHYRFRIWRVKNKK